MSVRFISETAELDTLEAVTATIEDGNAVAVYVDDALACLIRITRERTDEPSRFIKKPRLMLHGVPARDLEHLTQYLVGDAHSRSKVDFESVAYGFSTWIVESV